MNIEHESTIPINLIRPGRSRRSDGFTPPPDIDVEFILRLCLDSEANFYAGLLDDEPAGIFVPTYRKYKPGTLVAVALDLPGRHDLLVVNTIVRWLRDPGENSEIPPGIGLEFLHVATNTRTWIKRFTSQRPTILFET